MLSSVTVRHNNNEFVLGQISYVNIFYGLDRVGKTRFLLDMKRVYKEVVMIDPYKPVLRTDSADKIGLVFSYMVDTYSALFKALDNTIIDVYSGIGGVFVNTTYGKGVKIDTLGSGMYKLYQLLFMIACGMYATKIRSKMYIIDDFDIYFGRDALKLIAPYIIQDALRNYTQYFITVRNKRSIETFSTISGITTEVSIFDINNTQIDYYDSVTIVDYLLTLDY